MSIAICNHWLPLRNLQPSGGEKAPKSQGPFGKELPGNLRSVGVFPRSPIVSLTSHSPFESESNLTPLLYFASHLPRPLALSWTTPYSSSFSSSPNALSGGSTQLAWSRCLSPPNSAHYQWRTRRLPSLREYFHTRARGGPPGPPSSALHFYEENSPNTEVPPPLPALNTDRKRKDRYKGLHEHRVTNRRREK